MLHGLLVILIFVLVFVAVVAMIVARAVIGGIERLRSAARSAMGMDDGRASAGSGRASAGNGRSRGTDGGGAGNARRTRTADGTTIIDGRDPERAGRKIFAENDGEYVDFEERK